MTLERSADPLAFSLGKVVIQKIVGPSDAVEEMAGGEIGVRQVIGVAPRFVIDRCEGPSSCCVEILRFPLDRIRETDFGDRVGDGVLGSPFLWSRRFGRITLEGLQIREDARPFLAIRRVRAHAQPFDFFGGDKHARMHTLELRLELYRFGEQLCKRRRYLHLSPTAHAFSDSK